MSKAKTSKTKKVTEINEKQKISSFFKKIDPEKQLDSLDNDFKPKTIVKEKPVTEQKNSEKNTKKVPNVCNSKPTKEFKDTKSLKSQLEKNKILLNDSDDDFVFNTKPKQKTASTVGDKIKKLDQDPKKSIEKKDSVKKAENSKTVKLLSAVEEEIFKEVLNLSDEKKCSNPHRVVENDDSKLVVDLDAVDSEISIKSILEPIITPEKSYLKCDEALNDITNSKALDSLLNDIQLIKSNRKNSPPHSTPVANLKKRKSPENDIIPQTPEEVKSKSKVCQNKFKFQSLFKKDHDELEISEFLVHSPPKKVRKIITEPKMVVNLSEITEKQFQKLHGTNLSGPVKEVLSVDDISLFSGESPSLLQCPIKKRNLSEKISNCTSPISGVKERLRKCSNSENLPPKQKNSEKNNMVSTAVLKQARDENKSNSSPKRTQTNSFKTVISLISGPCIQERNSSKEQEVSTESCEKSNMVSDAISKQMRATKNKSDSPPNRTQSNSKTVPSLASRPASQEKNSSKEREVSIKTCEKSNMVSDTILKQIRATENKSDSPPKRTQTKRLEKSNLVSDAVLDFAEHDNSASWSAALKSPSKNLKSNCYEVESVRNETDSLLKYFKNLPSSCEERKGIEIQSNYLVTDKQTPRFEIDDLNFDDSWGIEVNEVKHPLNLESWQYCKINDIIRDLYHNTILEVESMSNKQEKTSVILQGIWRNLTLKKGDKINVIAKKTDEKGYIVNNDFGFVVYEPDTLISGTSIVGSLFCKRRGVLSDKFRGYDPENQLMIVGSIVHRLLQESLKQNSMTLADIEKILMEILKGRDIVLSSFTSDVPVDVIKQQTLPFVEKVYDFVSTYVYSKRTRDKKNWGGSIVNIEDIEENIWCHNYGIKGKIDVTLRTKKEKIKQYNAFSSSKNELTLPLELKTGKASFSLEHRGQVILYTMIMTELGYNVNSGLLLYLREGVLKEVEAKHVEKRDLIMLRNELAFYLNKRPHIPDCQSESSKSSKSSVKSEELQQLTFCELPEPIHHENACKRCPYATICTTFLTKETNHNISETHPLKNLSNELLSHLSQNHIDYFIQWSSLINIESTYKPPIKELKDIWRLPPMEREKLGKSLCFLQIFNEVKEKTEPFMHHFRSDDNRNFLNSGLQQGNYAVVSSDTRVAIAAGFISKITKDELVMGLERNLFERYSDKKFHIDTYESQSIFNYGLANMATLLGDSPKAKKLRELIIDKKRPEFASKLARIVAVVGENILKRLNNNQQRAILKVLSANDYLLIKGMPGTGKTATIVALIQLLVGLNKSVLVTSHTNSAVDNVCLRLIDCGVDVLRLGSESRIHPMLKHCSEHAKTVHCKTVEELQQVYDSAQVIAVTCYGASHPSLSKRMLDVCLVDESTQVLQCSVFKALQSTKKFVLIGDPEQLPPIVSNPDALKRGMSESLFERLHNPDNTMTLTLQYRMNKTITHLANNLTYNGQLLCADDSIGYAILRLPKIERLQTIYHNDLWLLSVLDTHVDNSVIGIDTGPTWKKMETTDVLEDLKVPVQNVQEDEDRNYNNVYEVAVITAIVEALKEAGVQSEAIGIIAPYRSQVMNLKKIISKIDEKFKSKDEVEVNTVDQYQGRDKEVIIFSCTKSRDPSKTKVKSTFEILEDKRRLTVAITRAKHKLIIIGDFCTLKTYSPFEVLLNSLEPHQVLPLAYESKGFAWRKVMDKLKTYDS